MQTFVPYPSILESVSVLDRRRLGKQRVETYQILRAALGYSKGWINHPATRMWRDNLSGLSAYGVACCDRWIDLGYKDTTRTKIVDLIAPDPGDLPFWWGLESIHVSHQSNLIRKDPAFYGPLFPGVPCDLEYVWPI